MAHKKPNERQVGGDHYNTYIQHWDFVIANNLGYLEGCITKYICRHRKKDGLKDLKKALHFLEKLIEIETLKLILIDTNDKSAEILTNPGPDYVDQ